MAPQGPRGPSGMGPGGMGPGGMGPGPMREGPRTEAPGDERMEEVRQALRRAMERIERLEAALRERGAPQGRPGGDRPSPEGLMREIEQRREHLRELQEETGRMEEMLRRLKEEMRGKGPGGERERNREKNREGGK